MYFLLWTVWLYHIFPHYLIKGMIFEKKIIEYKMCVLSFYTACVIMSYSKKNSARCYYKCTLVLEVKYPLFLSEFNEA